MARLQNAICNVFDQSHKFYGLMALDPADNRIEQPLECR